MKKVKESENVLQTIHPASTSKKTICPGDPKARFLSLFLIWRLREKPQHGYSLLQEVRGIEPSPSKPSTVYALLARLEKAGLVKSAYDNTSAHVRRTYQTTAKGWDLFLKIKEKHMKRKEIMKKMFLRFVHAMVD